MTNTVWTLTRHFDAWESSEIGIFSFSEIARASALARADDIDRVVERSIGVAVFEPQTNSWAVPETVLKESSDPGHPAGQLWVIQEREVQTEPLYPVDPLSGVEEEVSEAESEVAYWDNRMED